MADQDEIWMAEALKYARNGEGKTSPNPAVGAVIVKGGAMVGHGWHKGAGRPHAEIEALQSLAEFSDARGAEIFVTLEPCSTHGRTPPCTEAIVKAGFSRVVFGATDPNPAHAGRAVSLLRENGIEVRFGVLEEECEQLNRCWNRWIKSGLPWVVLKAGMSLDGRLTAPGGERWITSPEAREDAMKLRAGVDAILVGGNTVRADNPRLTVRGGGVERQPLRVVWTREERGIPSDCHLLSDEHRERTRLVVSEDFSGVLRQVGAMGVVRLLVEGGGWVHGAAIEEGLVDEAVIYIAPKVFGGGVPAAGGAGASFFSEALQLCEVACEVVGSDVKITGRVLRGEGEKGAGSLPSLT